MDRFVQPDLFQLCSSELVVALGDVSLALLVQTIVLRALFFASSWYLLRFIGLLQKFI